MKFVSVKGPIKGFIKYKYHKILNSIYFISKKKEKLKKYNFKL